MAPGGFGFLIFLFFFLILYQNCLKHGVLGPYKSPRISTQHKTSQSMAFKNAFKTNMFYVFALSHLARQKLGRNKNTKEIFCIEMVMSFVGHFRGHYFKFDNFHLLKIASHTSVNVRLGAKFPSLLDLTTLQNRTTWNLASSFSPLQHLKNWKQTKQKTKQINLVQSFRLKRGFKKVV